MAPKDSSVGFQSAASMKTLALLALAFLPKNFLVALFSAPLFDWDSARGDSIGVQDEGAVQTPLGHHGSSDSAGICIVYRVVIIRKVAVG